MLIQDPSAQVFVTSMWLHEGDTWAVIDESRNDLTDDIEMFTGIYTDKIPQEVNFVTPPNNRIVIKVINPEFMYTEFRVPGCPGHAFIERQEEKNFRP